MNNVLEDSLFVCQNKKFDEIQSIVRQFLAEYVGNSIVKDNIFAVIQNYARKKEISLELLRFPIYDDELWALTFLKQNTIFVCVNTTLPLCKQFFAAAHELYHIYCYVENADQSYIKNGSMLDSATGDETGRTQEDLEANAFAGLLLMPNQIIHEQIVLYGLDKKLSEVDSILMLMDMFAMPFKAVVLRLFESETISHKQAEKLLEINSDQVMKRVMLTGKAKRWQFNGNGTESFGTLFEKVEYNEQHEYLTESRKNDDVTYLAQLKKEYGLD
ncbi:MAG: ImmA/IrrE family metallo-endopeptidase [Lactobacillus sp.]|nr:ImmA/IrrE family metallo-endopeptidase [Lactobacillus sp.]